MNETFKDTAHAEPDRAGTEHVKFLNQMNQSIAKAET
jgi:hypothetical protein